MRAGALISAIAHAIMLTLLLLGTAEPYDAAPTETVTVDLVPSQEAPPEPAKPEPEKPEPQKPPEPELTVVLPTFTPAKPSVGAPSAQQASPAAPAKQKAAAPAPAASTPAKATSPGPAPSASAPAPAQPQPPPPAQKPEPSIFDPANIPTLMEMTPPPPAAVAEAPAFAFDAPAEVSANLSREDVAAFKSHVRKCLKLPAGVDPASKRRVVVRVFLKPDGALASDPMLIEASATPDGPAMVKAAQEALRQCQPYGFLPADKYQEWKVLDLTLSPQDMAGG